MYKSILVHPPARDFQLAACAAHLQGKFEAMESAIWSLTDGGPDRGGFQWNRAGLTIAAVYTKAAEIGLNVDQMKKDMQGACVKQLAADQADMRKFGVRGTPGFFINGRFLGGAQPIASFKAVIDEELKKFDSRKTPVAKYYNDWVVGKGKKSCCP